MRILVLQLIRLSIRNKKNLRLHTKSQVRLGLLDQKIEQVVWGQVKLGLSEVPSVLSFFYFNA